MLVTAGVIYQSVLRGRHIGWRPDKGPDITCLTLIHLVQSLLLQKLQQNNVPLLSCQISCVAGFVGSGDPSTSLGEPRFHSLCLLKVLIVWRVDYLCQSVECQEEDSLAVAALALLLCQAAGPASNKELVHPYSLAAKAAACG